MDVIIARIRQMHKSKLAMGSLVLLFAIIFAFIATTFSTNQNGKSLELVHIVIRHGARTPASTYPKDPYINNTFYPVGWGQLTNQGKLQLYELGKFLRERYDDYLGPFYTPDEYYAQSTDVDRAKASVDVVNAGLWPPKDEQVWGPLNWQPIPIKSQPKAQDTLLLVRKPCPQYNLELDRVRKLPEIQEKYKEFHDTFVNVEKFTGKEINDFEDVEDVHGTLQSEQAFGLELPDWTKDYFPDKIEEVAVFMHKFFYYTTKLRRLKGGLFVKKLLSDWKSKSDGTLEPKKMKTYFYGGHDQTIALIMSALDIFNDQIPPYGVALMFELSKDKTTGKYGVEIYIRNSTSDPILMTIPGCNSYCPLDDFVKLTAPVVPDNWEEECKTNDPNYVSPPPREA